MSEHPPHTIERHCDVAVIGGSAAGLAAALQLSRQRRSVIVVDAGEPRNAPAAHMHSYLGHEGLPPSELTTIGRDEVRSYGGEVIAGRAVDVTRTDDDCFRVELAGGHSLIARRVLAATGLVDELPDIDGLAQHWGGDVIHCPFCHGFEVRDRRIVQILTHRMGLHPAGLFRQLSAHFTLVRHDGVDADHPELEAMRAAGVNVVDGRVRRIVTGDDGHVAAVELTNGDRIDADAVVISARFRVRAEPFASLGLKPGAHPSGLGDFVETDATGATAIPGLYAAGNVTDPSQQVLQAAAAGSRVGAMISFSLAHDDIAAAARPSANQADWDHRYGGDQMWSGNPNGPQNASRPRPLCMTTSALPMASRSAAVGSWSCGLTPGRSTWYTSARAPPTTRAKSPSWVVVATIRGESPPPPPACCPPWPQAARVKARTNMRARTMALNAPP